jgi:hypothetical protein
MMKSWQIGGPSDASPMHMVREPTYAMLSVHWSIKMCQKLVTAPLCLFRNCICVELLQKQKEKHKVTINAHGLEEHMRITLRLQESSVNYFFYCVTLAYVFYFEEFLIHDSRGFIILKNN